MPVPLTHFAIGAAGMTVLAVFPLRLRARSTAIIVSGLWALVPDLYALAPPYTAGLRVLHDSAAANLFWFHGVLHALDTGNSRVMLLLAVGGWVGITLLIDLAAALRSASSSLPPDRMKE